MSITIDLPAEIEEKIKTQASNDGVKVEDYVKSLIKEVSERRERIENGSEKTFDEILASIRKGFQESGMMEDELYELIETEREAIWQERQNAQ